MKEKKSGSAFPIAVFFLVMGFVEAIVIVPVLCTASLTPTELVGLVGMLVVSFGGAVFFYWQHRRDKKYDVLIEQEDRERERQLQEQVSHQH